MKAIGILSHLAAVVGAQTIDLGYAQYSPSSTYKNITTYNNIRYAAPPLGTLRFAAPAAPLQETAVNDGSEGYTCPFAYPQNSLTSGGYNSAREQSEDCLFVSSSHKSFISTDTDWIKLDVYVPPGLSSTSNVPVLVWIYGVSLAWRAPNAQLISQGGYTAGSKDLYPGYGLIEASNNSIIFVAMNYRLGAFGFSAGPTYGQEGGIGNLGLLDQAFALTWVKNHISKFGGDPTQVTVAGESAGASSIMFQLAANSGDTTPNFHRAIMQSPAVLPEFQSDYLEATYQNFSSLAGCPNADLSCLQAANTSVLIAANTQQIQNNPHFGTFVYGPNVDYDFVAALPTVEILSGHFQKMPMLLSFVGNESAIFANPNVTTSADFDNQIAGFLPNVTAEQYMQIAAQYPSANYSSQYARLSQFIDDSLVDCNVRTLATSNPSSSYVYEFNVGTAHHGSDVLYTFLNSFSVSSAAFGLNDADVVVAEGIQAAITSFVINGDPVGIPNYSSKQIKVLTETSTTTVHDPNDNSRCSFWAKASYDPDSAAILATSAASASSSASPSSAAASTATADKASTSANATGAASASKTASIFSCGMASILASMMLL